MKRPGLPEKLIVGWGSKFQTMDGYIPVSDQVWRMDSGKDYFIEHVGRQLILPEILKPLFEDHPEVTSIDLIFHYDKAELIGQSNGVVDFLFHFDSRLYLKLEQIIKAIQRHHQVMAAARELGCSDAYIHDRMKRAGLNLAQVLESPDLASLLHGRN